jgi:hypothetical protein
MIPSKADGACYQDTSSLHKYRTELPNIIFSMNLDPWAFKMYCILKKTAGDAGQCFKSNNTLADEVGCSIPTLIKIKKQLEEEGLITITKRKDKNGSDIPDLIQIVDIWPLNMEIMSKQFPRDSNKDPYQFRNIRNKNFNEEGKQDLGGGLNSFRGGVNEIKGEGKRGLHKEEPLQEEPFKKDDDDRAGAREKNFCKDDVHFICAKKNKDWQPDEIDEAWESYAKYASSVTDPAGYIESIINKNRLVKENQKNKRESCLAKPAITETLQEKRANSEKKFLELVTKPNVLEIYMQQEREKYMKKLQHS